MSNQRLTFAQKMNIPLAPLDASSRGSAAAEIPSSSLNSQQQRPSFSQLMNAPLDAKSSSRASAAAEPSSSSLNSRHQQPPQQAQQRPSFSQLMNAPLDAKSSSRGSAAAELSSSSLNSRHQQPPQQAQQRLTFAERMTVPIDAAKSSSRTSASLFLPLPLEEDEEPTDTTAHQPRFTGSRSLPVFVFFHKEYDRYGFLSNFYMPATFTDPISNIVFTSSEKYYMAAKAAVAQNAKSFHDIMETNDPSTAKRIGSSFEVPTEWDWLKVGVMEVACYLKFSQNRVIGKALLDTGDAQLVEAAPNDSFWGIGINENKARHTERSMWPGTNFLGQVLMGVRQHLKDNTAPEASSQASQIISNFIKTSEELKRLIHPQPSSQTSSLADVRLAGDDDGYAETVGLLREFANSKEHIYIWDPKNALVNASKIELQMYEKYLKSGGSSSSVSKEAREHMRSKLAKYILRFIEEQQQLQLPREKRQHQQQQQHGIHSMGFPKADVERALAQTNNNEEQAIDFLISQQQPQQPQRQQQRQHQQQQQHGIHSMGFPDDDVQVALTETKGDEERAIQILLHKLVTNLLTEVRQNNQSWINRKDVEDVVMKNLNTSNIYGESKAILFAIPRPEGFIEEGASSSKFATYIREMPVRRVGGEGNCLFLSLVGSLTNLFEHLGDEVAAAKHAVALASQASMRKAIVDFESKHWNEEVFYQAASIDSESPQLQVLQLNDPSGSVGDKERYYDEQNVGKYFKLMATDGMYGTDVEIMTAARMFGVTIFVQIEQGNRFARYSSSSNPDEITRVIYLYKADMHNHYDWKDPYSKHGGGKQKQQKQQKSRKINCKKLSKRYSRYKKNLYKYSSPTQAQKMATKYLGKTAKLYPANNPVKKYRICDPVSKKWVNFGQLGYEDYTRHKNKTRRHNYLTRTANMRGNWKSNKYSANNLSRRVLWN